MAELTREQIEQVLDARVRPMLSRHEGDIQLLSFQDGVLRFRLLGQCGSCPSAVLTAEELVAPALKQALSEVEQVVLDTSVSDELWGAAKAVLRARREERECASR